MTLPLLWATPTRSDNGDADVWRAACPHWVGRAAQDGMRKHAQALAGEDDPKLGDPDPMAGSTRNT